ncbi:MAG TPA: glycosyltransferase family A protein [Acidobacteriaceae bacterium]|nr:glycosyltransferase family A protein [Acidobacteriaceae bacterium]
MLISVVIPTYNRPDLLLQTLESVLAQTYKDIEIIVVDDGSTAETGELLDKFSPRVQSIRLGRSGISTARNTGIDAAQGEFIAFVDHDDLWHPQKIEKHVEFASAHPELAMTYTDAIEFSKEGPAKITYVDHFSALKQPAHLFAPMIATYAVPLMSATMIRKSFLREKGLSFPNYFGIDDVGLFLMMLVEGGQFGYLPEPLTMRRMHEGNTSSNHRRRFEQRKLMYRDMLQTDRLGDYRDRYTPQQKSALKFGLRDATYRVAECDWEDCNFAKARQGFFQTLAADTRGINALAHGLLTFLPPAWLATMRRLKSPA